ncbi:unnamed protein product [Acanthoscelides obtectus]|uniref:Uncharacterized protein n=1 Tax=Acanthoscelides obtectus TaxID=200917 RepID=A0A9P0KG59_ACAOB|nr:unnamed protein product [Acanthoscelides obtectus]CAK1672633.1 hypothetical protein AOBTE_LOCUS29005 [Acanthoscelides obtectus]
MHNFLVLGFTAILVYGSSIDHTKQLTLKKSHHEQRKMNYKVVPHRCSIVCPLKLELPSCLGALPLQNTSQSSNKTFPMQQDATTIPVLPNLANLTQYLPHIDPNQLYEQVSNGLSQLFQMFQPSNLQIPSGKSRMYFIFHYFFFKKYTVSQNIYRAPTE